MNVAADGRRTAGATAIISAMRPLASVSARTTPSCAPCSCARCATRASTCARRRTGHEAVEAFSAAPPDLLVLDIGLPDADGRDVCQALRVARRRRPGAVPHRARGADRPALRLPRRRRRLPDQAVRARRAASCACGRCCAAARPRRPRRRPPAGCGSTRRRTACASATRAAALTPTEFRLLAALAARPGEVVRRRELVAAAWPDGAIVHDNTLDTYIGRLRRKLRDARQRRRRSRPRAASATCCGETARPARPGHARVGRRARRSACSRSASPVNLLLATPLDARRVVAAARARRRAARDARRRARPRRRARRRRRRRARPAGVGLRRRRPRRCGAPSRRRELQRGGERARARPGAPTERTVGDRCGCAPSRRCAARRRGARRRPSSSASSLRPVRAHRADRAASARCCSTSSCWSRARCSRAARSAWRCDPVAEMTAHAADWSEHDLDRRFDLGPPRDELTAPVGDARRAAGAHRRGAAPRAALLGRDGPRAAHAAQRRARRGRARAARTGRPPADAARGARAGAARHRADGRA